MMVVYSTMDEPDLTDARQVLAFLLVPDDAFFDRDTTACERADVAKMLNGARRHALLTWYASHTRGR